MVWFYAQLYYTFFNVVFIPNVIVNEHIVIVNNSNIQCRRDVDVSLLRSILRKFRFILLTQRRQRSLKRILSCFRLLSTSENRSVLQTRVFGIQISLQKQFKKYIINQM